MTDKRISKIFDDHPNPPCEGGDFDDALWECICDCVDFDRRHELPLSVNVYMLVREAEWTACSDGCDAMLFNEKGHICDYLDELSEYYEILGINDGASTMKLANDFIRQSNPDWRIILGNSSAFSQEEKDVQDKFLDDFCALFVDIDYGCTFDSYHALIPYVIKHRADFELIEKMI